MSAETETPAPALIWPQALPTPLPRFLLLAVLLHVWLVLMLGNAPGGTAREGQGVYGRLNIILQGPAVGSDTAVQAPQLPATPTGAAGAAEQQRYGGAVRDRLPQPDAPAGAARLGDWSPTLGQPDGQRAAPAPLPTPPGQGAPATATISAPDVTPKTAPDPLPRAITDQAPDPKVEVPSAEWALQRNLAPVPRPEAALPSVAAAATPAPVLATAVPNLNSTPVAAPVRQLGPAPTARSAAQAPLSAPLPVPLPPAVTALPAVPVPVPVPSAQLPPASAERSLASRLAAERALQGLPALPESGRLATAPLQAAVPAPPNKAVAAPPAVTVPNPAPAPSPAPAQASTTAAPAAPGATAQAAPAAATSGAGSPAGALGEAATAQLPRAAPGAEVAPQAALPSVATGVSTAVPMQGVPKVGSPLAQPGQGSADAGSRLGNDVATAASTAASAPKRLNLELPRMKGGEISRYSTTGVLPALPRPPEVPDKLGNAIEKAAKEDCRKAYAGAGLLAVVPLLVDAVRDGGCKW